MAPSLATTITILCSVFIALPVIAVVLRFYARFLKNTSISADDYLIVPGLLFSVGLSANNIVAVVHGGLGEHIHMDPKTGFPLFDQTLSVFLQTEFASQLLSVLSLVFTKLSIVVFYRRIFRGRVFSYLSALLLCLIAGWGISFFFATLFECSPISQAWTSLIARIYFFFQSSDSYANAFDITVNIAPTLYWTVLEASIAVVSACLPTLRPLFSGFSLGLETFLQDFASRFSIRSTSRSNKSNGGAGSLASSHRSGKVWIQSLPNPSASSRAEFVNKFELEEQPPISLQDQQHNSQAGITVHKSFYQTEYQRQE
ncbi:hypothetical protein V8F20_002855 [Naviculisporaceae sp. PSN 640]